VAALFHILHHSHPAVAFEISDQGRRLGFESGEDNYGERSEPKKNFPPAGKSPETLKITLTTQTPFTTKTPSSE